MQLDLNFTYSPERVISIVGPSRSGSTVLTHALGLHPELTTLAGEHEPYFKLCKCGWPWHSSDEFHVMKNAELFRILVANELHGNALWHNRKWLRTHKIEEPPFVEAKYCRRTPILLLKTPQDCYRSGVLAQIFPESRIDHIVTTRDPRAIVNGLIDGWLSGEFTARWIEQSQAWFCFDMPPGWSYPMDDNALVDTCIHQCQTAQLFCERDFKHAYKARYEDLVEDWRGYVEYLWRTLGLSAYPIPPNAELPELATTDKPDPNRWKGKRPWLAEKL